MGKFNTRRINTEMKDKVKLDNYKDKNGKNDYKTICIKLEEMIFPILVPLTGTIREFDVNFESFKNSIKKVIINYPDAVQIKIQEIFPCLEDLYQSCQKK